MTPCFGTYCLKTHNNFIENQNINYSNQLPRMHHHIRIDLSSCPVKVLLLRFLINLGFSYNYPLGVSLSHFVCVFFGGGGSCVVLSIGNADQSSSLYLLYLINWESNSFNASHSPRFFRYGSFVFHWYGKYTIQSCIIFNLWITSFSDKACYQICQCLRAFCSFYLLLIFLSCKIYIITLIIMLHEKSSKT